MADHDETDMTAEEFDALFARGKKGVTVGSRVSLHHSWVQELPTNENLVASQDVKVSYGQIQTLPSRSTGSMQNA